uniref:Protein shisa-4-like n=1 Tax=Crassostrea virginica TaxID=6565 RepID=A0A8B8BAZ2_CRAVI|nr:protein shisa-4-like [Crassostrea virginica]
MDTLNSLLGVLIGTLLILIDVPAVLAAYSCSSYYPYRRELCYGGQSCCGYSSYRYCCNYMNGGALAGIIIGTLIGVACLIMFIIFCCKAMNKNRGSTGRVVYPNNGGNVAIVNNTTQSTTGGYPQPGYSMYPTAPAYPPGSGPAYPPGSGPAYPPGTGPAYSMAGPSQYPPPPPQYSQTDPAPFPAKY